MASRDIISRNVKRFREERELSMGALARRSGLAKQTIAALESGDSNPTVETLDRLADALEVSARALMTELGTEILVNRGGAARWQQQGGIDLRPLDQAFGSGYVINAVLRLEAARGPFRPRVRGRGSLRHCYVLDGAVLLGPEQSPVAAQTGDFVRFPADAAGTFEAISPVALVFVCTTAPQLSMTGADRAI
ncbi:XRE family transcriptional regulator [Microbacterium sp. No. 7]|uniref:XRE family transcriptional regulator n=1 Tax=Microbacterium sp. No. 7 TaxID=1714373 RepID=UPI0006D19AFD|nr:XRE family transcriptional regulator [Microbacterium sp. No. 7]ALJ21782.1 hypothetical protein AOA12_18535 [Microbacterium sp. No. 7]